MQTAAVRLSVSTAVHLTSASEVPFVKADSTSLSDASACMSVQKLAVMKQLCV